jgi:hypothetical protein
MRGVKPEVMPVIKGTNGTIPKIIQTIPERQTSKALNLGTTGNSHIGHCSHTSASSEHSRWGVTSQLT